MQNSTLRPKVMQRGYRTDDPGPQTPKRSNARGKREQTAKSTLTPESSCKDEARIGQQGSLTYVWAFASSAADPGRETLCSAHQYIIPIAEPLTANGQEQRSSLSNDLSRGCCDRNHSDCHKCYYLASNENQLCLS